MLATALSQASVDPLSPWRLPVVRPPVITLLHVALYQEYRDERDISAHTVNYQLYQAKLGGSGPYIKRREQHMGHR